MKKSLIFLFFGLLIYFPMQAQVTPFKFEIGGLYGLPTDEFYKGGVGFYAHPSYYVMDKLDIGIKAEWVIIGGASDLGDNVSISAIGSYMLTSNYYFTVSKVRPYVGIALGLYNMGSLSSDLGGGSSVNLDYGSKFGFAPKIGLDLGHFTLNASYNMILGIDEILPKKDYISIGVGVFFGGGVQGKGAKKSKSKYITIDEDEDF